MTQPLRAPSRIDNQGQARHERQLAPGAWFGESDGIFRLGLGYLQPDRLGPALSALSTVLDAARAK